MKRRTALPLGLFATCAVVYVCVLGERALSPSPNNHFVHLANSWLHGQLSVLGGEPPGHNDWALYQGRWFVSFPPFPALLLTPFVALFGTGLWDRLLWALLAATGPSLCFVVLRSLGDRQADPRSERRALSLSVLYAFGTVYFFVAVQGSVWFAAHVVATPLVWLYIACSLEARRPVWAGLCLGLCFMTRASTAFLAVFFAVEALNAFKRPDGPDGGAAHGSQLKQLRDWLRERDWPAVLGRAALFAAPVCAVGALAMWHNYARFENPFVFGHEYLQVRWRGRIETWGLFNYHYFPKNLAIFVASLPWLSSVAPYVRISGHGLALWFTTPNLLWAIWPAQHSARLFGAYASVLVVGLLDLCYQNSGWVQFGYRFSLDYMPFLFLALALGGRRFGLGFHAVALVAVLVNLFGAVTFDRYPKYYDIEPTQRRIFQPD